MRVYDPPNLFQKVIIIPGVPFILTAAITRPADANQYTAKDVVGGSVAEPLVFRFGFANNKTGFWIMNPVLVSSNPAAASGSFKLLLFREPPVTPVDNAVFAPGSGDLSDFLGMVVFDTAIKVSTATLYVPSSFSPMWGTLKNVYDRFFGVLLDDAAYTPASTEIFTITLAGQWE